MNFSADHVASTAQTFTSTNPDGNIHSPQMIFRDFRDDPTALLWPQNLQDLIGDKDLAQVIGQRSKISDLRCSMLDIHQDILTKDGQMPHGFWALTEALQIAVFPNNPPVNETFPYQT